MILQGVFFRFGTVMDEKKIPLHLRKRQYIVRQGEIDVDEERLKAQESAAVRMQDDNPEKTNDEIDQEIIMEDEEKPSKEEVVRHRIANRPQRR
ncbi:MAG TPA: hypothetical protein VNZ45_01690 [Bacteroidia bacterium]|jgi:hypothetical protein|nr:hypothetical protein [Bacteroidia bacterium]